MKRILTTLSQKWPEYILEILVIVIGIYGAFALDRWNENTAAINKEKILLNAVNNEFIANKEQFKKVVANHKQVYAHLQWLKQQMPFNQHTNKDSLHSHFRGTWTTQTFNPSASSIDAIVNTGSLDIIRNEELRNLLVKWDDVLLDYQEEENMAKDFHWGEYFSSWRTLIDFDHFFDGGSGFIDVEVLNGRIAKNLIVQRSAHFRIILTDGELEEIDEMLDRIIELTDQQVIATK